MTACADPAGTVGFFLCRAGQHLRAAAIETPRLEARLLLAHAMGCRQEDLLRDPRAVSRRPPPPASARCCAAGWTMPRSPICSGIQEFWSLRFAVSPATLIPRADSRDADRGGAGGLVPRPRRGAPGAGSRHRDRLPAAGGFVRIPAAPGLGVDRVPAAAALARHNAATTRARRPGRFAVADWAAPVAGRFDLMLCNPPYIESATIPGLMPEVARHEPASALDGGADGLDAYRAIVAALPGLLAPGGRAILELGQGQQPAVEAIAAAQGLRSLGCRADLGGVPRALLMG